jgi:hypothetical protein
MTSSRPTRLWHHARARRFACLVPIALVLSACGRIDYLPNVRADGGLDADLDADLDAFSPDAFGPDAGGPDAFGPDTGPSIDAANDSALLDAAIDAFAPDAFACMGTDRIVDGRCVPFVSQLDFDDDGFGDLVIGAQNAPPMAAGVAYFYRGTSTGPLLVGTFRAGNPDERVGFTTLDAHDVNGDGIDDVIVSGHNFSFGQAYAFHGGSSPIETSVATLSSTGAVQFGQFMTALSGGAIVVGEDGASRAHLFQGAPGTGLPDRPSITFSPPSLLQLASGDVNGDGERDLLVLGASGGQGRVFVYHAPLGDPPTLTTTIDAPTDVTFTGFATARLGGVGDDLVVGTSGGSLLVYLGAGDGLMAVPTVVAAPADVPGFAAVVANLGDVDRDGDDELAVAADLADATRVFVYLGQRASPYAVEGRAITLPAATGRTRVALGASDVDGDGEIELVIGDPLRQHVYWHDDPLGAQTLEYDMTDPGSNSFGFSIASR